MAPVKVPSALCHERGPGIVDSSGEEGLVWNLDDSEKNKQLSPTLRELPLILEVPFPLLFVEYIGLKSL
ncbi:hypothetical protein CABS01_06572 [Colletotrichum abscissum]|uniref:uncharacterized protein n=1 Tax=Colletotrichum abscissum TaxID=1671311 RepID=UPI0027D7065A|nr:uncharacterized protein CABS01_06572 [Colletotrichum abscissum]KAK1516605.1 hypothetical protein CABS01_06572 [Colletotrichum abscissum]